MVCIGRRGGHRSLHGGPVLKVLVLVTSTGERYDNDTVEEIDLSCRAQKILAIQHFVMVGDGHSGTLCDRWRWTFWNFV